MYAPHHAGTEETGYNGFSIEYVKVRRCEGIVEGK